MRLPILSILCGLFALGLVASAEAQGTDHGDGQARAHFQAAQAYFETGSYEEAIREFEQAYRLSGRAQLLYNLYLCHERLGNLPEAIDHLSRYLEAHPDAPNAASLQARLENLRKRAATPGAGEEPAEVTQPAQPVTEAPNETPIAPSRGNRALPIAVLSVGGVGLLSFGAFALLTAREDSDLDDSCAEACSDAQVKSLRTYSLVADVSLGIGVAGVLTAGVLWWVGRDRAPQSARAVRVAPQLGLTQLGLVAEGRF